MAPPPSAPLQVRILALMKTLQFAWFFGHVSTILGTALYAFSVLTFNSKPFFYKYAFFGAVLSYGVVIYKSHGTPQPSGEYMRKLVMDENAQYFILALYWFMSNPISVTLVPFFTFSAFHALGYVRNNIIPNVFPTAARTNGDAPATWQAKAQQGIKTWTDKYYSTAMRFVAHSEVTIIAPRLILGLFRLNFVPLFLFAQFLRFRYHLSSYTRQAFTELRVKCDKLLLPPNADPRIPPGITNAYNLVKHWITRFGEAGVQRQPAAAQ
ncbi:hypothetical protein CU097_015251 [Rhizopus azygosporus]|uniref:Transmembrane protein 33 n=2 Tax=Rhizopus TaxID=4842 RepID=A0A367KA85_RHIAZ|nr:hypothetical protein BCV71DRAFT_87729 [Rhizopus microsporus]RCH99098.1 hypothetical protein CU097_015251 [Rhizopus azygosporus]CEG66997.1 hypothetical protein RMATCC62417_03483 [Rhizopus microsporus]CEI91900.1 hypothetical protein RMCBS344292_06177 [Rhizopus microsporus]CEI93037.1 hypothetical protein RMCBS344292_07281 [Rhizopus microsporus]